MTQVKTRDFAEHFGRFLRGMTRIPREHHKEIVRFLIFFMEAHDYEAAFCEHRREGKKLALEIHSTVNALRRRSRNAKLPPV